MSTNDTNGMKAFTVRMDAELARRLSVLAALESKSREQWIREALELVAARQEERNASR